MAHKLTFLSLIHSVLVAKSASPTLIAAQAVIGAGDGGLVTGAAASVPSGGASSNYCGSSWGDANSKCATSCPGGVDREVRNRLHRCM